MKSGNINQSQQDMNVSSKTERQLQAVMGGIRIHGRWWINAFHGGIFSCKNGVFIISFLQQGLNTAFERTGDSR